MARLQNEVGTKDFFRGTNLLTKNAPKFSPKFLSLYLVGPKKLQNSRQISRKISLPEIKKNHRRASAGVATLTECSSSEGVGGGLDSHSLGEGRCRSLLAFVLNGPDSGSFTLEMECSQ